MTATTAAALAAMALPTVALAAQSGANADASGGDGLIAVLLFFVACVVIAAVLLGLVHGVMWCWQQARGISRSM